MTLPVCSPWRSAENRHDITYTVLSATRTLSAVSVGSSLGLCCSANGILKLGITKSGQYVFLCLSNQNNGVVRRPAAASEAINASNWLWSNGWTASLPVATCTSHDVRRIWEMESYFLLRFNSFTRACTLNVTFEHTTDESSFFQLIIFDDFLTLQRLERSYHK